MFAMAGHTSREKIIQFKNFINMHPKLLIHVRKNGLSWQDYFDQWLLLGENHSYWDKFASSHNQEKASDINLGKRMEQIDQFINSMNVEKVQKGLKDLNNIISSLDGLLQSYLKSKEKTPSGSFNIFQNFKD